MEYFNGYVRENGSVGIRNHVLLIANCSCATGVVSRIASEVPGAVEMPHTYGCSVPGEYERWERILIGVCTNPNIFAVVLVGVGCEDKDAELIAWRIREVRDMPVFVRIVQRDGGGENVIRACVEKAREFVRQACASERVPVPVSSLVLGTECGGSDALSGITANPAIGCVADWVCGQGGTAIFSEVAEMIGAEEILAERAANPVVADKIRKIIELEETEVRKYLGPDAARIIARGNMEGGLTTIQEKALGCIRKGGTGTIMDVLEYAEPVGERKGLLIMRGPGLDPVSLTGLFACGAQVILFSTGRGNPLGFPAAPCIKVCSNTQTYRMTGGEDGDMDIDAGRIVSAGAAIQEVGEECRRYLLDVCNGMLSIPEKRKYGGTMSVYANSTQL